MQSSCDRACGDLANLFRILGYLLAAFLGLAVAVYFVGGGFLGFVLTLVVCCGGLCSCAKLQRQHAVNAHTAAGGRAPA